MTDQQHPTGFSPPAPPPPTYQAPPNGAFLVPSGGYTAPAAGYAVPPAPEKRSPLIGALSLIASLIASVVMPIIAAVVTFDIGRRLPDALEYMGRTDDLSFLSPVRDQVLWAELSFWAGTALGLAAFVLGIVAIVRKQGRGQGIAGLVVSVLGPAIYPFAALMGVTMGALAAIPTTFS